MLNVDSDGVFDYNTGKSSLYTIQDYLKMIESEIEEVHAMRQMII
jgi:hypothetical protein